MSSRRFMSWGLARHGLVLAAAASLAWPAAGTPYLWLDGPGHLWSNPALWSPQGVPGAGDTVKVLTGIVDVSDTREVASLTLAATRIGAGTLTTGSLLFAGGSLGGDGSGSGVLQVTGLATLAGDAALALQRNNRLLLNGDTTWTAGNGNVSVRQSSRLVIGSGTVFTDLGASGAGGAHSLSADFDTGGRIQNLGTYRRQGEGTTALVRFDNSGRFVLEAGRVVTDNHFSSSGSILVGAGTQFELHGGSAGTMDVVAGGRLLVSSLASSFLAGLGGTIQNAGTVVVSGTTAATALSGRLVGGTLEMASGLLNVTSADSQLQLLLANGGSQVGAGTLRTARLEWHAGGGFGVSGQNGSGTTVVTDSAWIDGAVTHTVDANHDLWLGGASTWTAGNGAMRMDHGGRVVVGAGGVFVDEGTATAGASRAWSLGDRGGAVLVEGTYIRRGLGNTDLDRMRNNGLLIVEQGSVTMQRQFSNGGELRLAPGTTATFTDNRAVLDGTLSGDGRLRAFQGTDTVTATGTIDPGMPGAFGRLDVDGGLLLTEGAVLRLGIGSLLEHDLLAVHGSFTANGLLALWADDELELELGDRLTLMRYDELATGSAFDRVSFSGLDRYRFELRSLPGWLELEVTAVLPPPTPGVPEPGTLGLLLAAALGARLAARRGRGQRLSPGGR